MQNVVKVASLQIHEDTRKEALDSLAAKINKIANIKINGTNKSFLFNVVWHDRAYDYSATLHIFYAFDTDDIDARHCTICQEVNSTFYKLLATDCKHCEYNAYKKRIEERQVEMKQAGREILKRNA